MGGLRAGGGWLVMDDDRADQGRRVGLLEGLQFHTLVIYLFEVVAQKGVEEHCGCCEDTRSRGNGSCRGGGIGSGCGRGAGLPGVPSLVVCLCICLFFGGSGTKNIEDHWSTDFVWPYVKPPPGLRNPVLANVPIEVQSLT